MKFNFQLSTWILAILGIYFTGTATAANANETTIDPKVVLVDSFEGWGTSHCWWANVVGGYTNREEYADLAFKQLGLNIVRYNIGGGENPAIHNALEFRARVPGFQPEPGQWNWNADANQRWVLRAAVARGANHVVAFANSPPYWMTVSGSVTGSTNGSDNNLRTDCEAAFASYLATVVSNLTVLDGVKFDTVTPMNEPGANWWKFGNRQEGMHMSAAQQARMISQLRAALDRNGLSASIVASEDNDEQSTCESIAAYDPAALGEISKIVTHTYHANDPRRLRELARAVHKPLWVSEYGDGERTGLALARRIRDDVTDLHASAWIYWQFVDRGGWGLVASSLNGSDETYQLTRKFHVMAQFSRFIRPGCEILGASDHDSLVAYDRANGRLIIVAVNDQTTARAVTYNLMNFETTGSEVLPHRTSKTEQVAALKPLPVKHGKFTVTLPAQSVTTFEISNARLDPINH